MGLFDVSAIFGKWCLSGYLAVDQFNCRVNVVLKVFYGSLDELTVNSFRWVKSRRRRR